MSYNFLVQRIVLETMETASNVAPSTLRCPHASSTKKLWTSPLLNTIPNPIVSLQYPTPSKASSSDNSTYHGRLLNLDYDECRIDDTDSIFVICESRCRSNEKLLDVCHECPSGLIDGCPFPSDALSETDSEAHLDRSTSDSTGQWQVTRNAEAMYAKVKKLPESSSKNNIKTGALCKDGYEMVDSSHYDNPLNGFQRLEIASVSTRTLHPTFESISTSMVDFDNRTKDEEGNEIFANVMNTTYTGNVQIYEDGNTLSIRE
ncbi:hypothetical protein CHS0354_037850 [Potamilus streckersoni]|uniref:Uncharacterized protein n=1 Tax=Potamilus streckersoni TaxID=2493646 RepID=A0AAE0VXD6_9BIVA|nr:hypothetical protein CHS0354_037845 [Potamilus streckersoni]KAK3592715.1 hypothetical protein CHS0354_037850 [Potamilus streckersoni]